MIESLKQIKAAEKTAQQRIEDAQQNSVSGLERTRGQAKDVISQAEADARQRSDAMMEQACSEAKAEAEKIIQTGLSDAQGVRDAGGGRVEGAVKVIVRRVTGEA